MRKDTGTVFHHTDTISEETSIIKDHYYGSVKTPEIHLSFAILQIIQSIVAVIARIAKADSVFFFYPAGEKIKVIATNPLNYSSISIGNSFSINELFPDYLPKDNLVTISMADSNCSLEKSILLKIGFKSVLIKSAYSSSGNIFGYVIMGFNYKDTLSIDCKANILDLVEILEKSLESVTSNHHNNPNQINDTVFRDIIDETPEPILLTDMEDDFVFANKAFYERIHIHEWELKFFNSFNPIISANTSGKNDKSLNYTSVSIPDGRKISFHFTVKQIENRDKKKKFKVYYLTEKS